MNETSFENKVAILADLWIAYRNDPGLQDFIAYNDLGLPLAYALNRNIVEIKANGKNIIEESFSMLLDVFDIDDLAWENLDDFWETISDTNLD